MICIIPTWSGLNSYRIVSWLALDHLLFLLVLAVIYCLSHWKQVLVLITAFTLGHSITLALSVYDVFRLKDKLVEFLIPCTIMATALFNIMVKKINAGPLRLNYFLALFFGLIHGMGFANAICFMLAKNQRIAIPLISFNIGLEAGQLVVVTAILLISYLQVDKPGIKRNGWIWTLSGTAFFIASKMAIERWPL